MGVIIPTGFGLAKLKFKQLGASEDMIVTWGFDGDVAEVPATDAAEIHAIMVATGRPCAAVQFSSLWRFNGVDVIRQTATGPISGSSTGYMNGGTSLSTAPPNTALLLRKNTARGGRMGKGRCFLPPLWIAENNLDEYGAWAGSNISTAQALWDSALTALLASDCPPVLLHSDGSTPNAITSWTLQGTAATQRRRMRR